jgi:hypothetical protein
MRIEACRDGLKIYADTELEKAYIEDTLGLRESGDSIKLKRRTVSDVCHIMLQTEK